MKIPGNSGSFIVAFDFSYDAYVRNHRENVRRGLEWLRTNLPALIEGKVDYAWLFEFDHDESKNSSDEYFAYDAYFYGGNRSHAVVEEFRKAWLLHIHRNPHHWQYWVLINDDPKEGEIILEMPYHYIIEMICDWWAFSWQKGDLSEIFSWYDEHSAYIKLAPKTRQTVEDILWEIRGRLGFNTLTHHGVKGMKWGVRNGPPYPLDKSSGSDTIVQDAIDSGKVSTKINREKQMRHTKDGHEPGRSYLDGDLDYAQELVDKYSGTGEALCVDGEWNNRERIVADSNVGVYVNEDGVETESNKAIIIYSKTGTHVYPVRKENKDGTT